MEQDTYTLLREFADSWFLLAMVIFFVGVCAFAFRPGSRRMHRDIAEIPLRDDDPARLRDGEDGDGEARGDAGRDDGPRGDARGDEKARGDARGNGRRRDAGRPIEES